MATKRTVRSGKSGPEGKRDVSGQDEGSYLSPSGVRRFILEVYAEFRKIVWSGKKQTAGLTGFVVLLVVVLSLYLGSVDLLLGKLVSTVLN